MGASSIGIGRRRPLPRKPAPMVDIIRNQTRAFEIAEYEAVLMAQSDDHRFPRSLDARGRA